jgi:hypothetical protein
MLEGYHPLSGSIRSAMPLPKKENNVSVLMLFREDPKEFNTSQHHLLLLAINLW